MAEIQSVEGEESSGGRTRRCSCDVILDNSDVPSPEYNSDQERDKSAEPQLAQVAEISNDVQTDNDLSSMGTYLVVPGQDQTLKTTPDDKRNPLHGFSYGHKNISLDEMPSSSLLSHDSLLETAVEVDTAASSDITDYSNFQVLESVLQQSSSPGVREGYISPQHMTSVDEVADSNSMLEEEATSQQYLASYDSLDYASNERLFRVCNEHIAQQRIVSVDREQCVTKEHAAMSFVRGPNAPSRHHRAVTVSRSQTWSFRDKAKSDQFLREAGSVNTQGSQLSDKASAHDLDFTVNSHSRSERSKTLPHQRSSQIVRLLPCSLEEPPASGVVQACLLRDYNKDKDWSFVPWNDEQENR